jgi:hypothetical protein
MTYHVVTSCGHAHIKIGPDPNPQSTFDSFEKAKAWAIRDLEHWKAKIEGSLEELREASTITDLPYHDPSAHA